MASKVQVSKITRISKFIDEEREVNKKKPSRSVCVEHKSMRYAQI